MLIDMKQSTRLRKLLGRVFRNTKLSVTCLYIHVHVCCFTQVICFIYMYIYIHKFIMINMLLLNNSLRNFQTECWLKHIIYLIFSLAKSLVWKIHKFHDLH